MHAVSFGKDYVRIGFCDLRYSLLKNSLHLPPLTIEPHKILKGTLQGLLNHTWPYSDTPPTLSANELAISFPQ